MSYLDSPPVLDFETKIRNLPEVELELRLAAARKHSSAEFRLAASLIAYVSEDDAKLPRDQFLRMVLNRIVDHLGAPLPRSP
jgi:plasmid stability protein